MQLYSFTASQLHSFTASQLHSFTSSQPHIFTASHLHSLTASHLHSFTSSQLHILTALQLHSLTASHLHIFTAHSCKKKRSLYCRVTCTRWLLGLAVKAPWLGPGGPILALAARTSLENSPCKRFISGREGCLGPERVYDN